jgi:hypothetical protein
MANYHPCLPMKRMQMVEDIVDMEGQALFWSSVGSAGIGLPFLAKEIDEPPPTRLRFYGYLSDREFCEECAKRGITVFGVLWKAHLWEFPAEFSEDESELLSLNITRGVGRKGWLGIRELSQDRYPKLLASMREFLPEGLYDSDGEEIVDYLAGLKSESLEGRDIFSRWLMAPGHEHLCYMPCCNKPAYDRYTRRNVEMMIDAGVGGVLIDEPESQKIAMSQSGCFCKECRKGFRQYLKDHPSPEAEALGLDLDSFDYRDFLRERGIGDDDIRPGAGPGRWRIPLLREWTGFQLAGSIKNIADWSAYIREYSSATRGAPLPVTANIFDGSARGLHYLQHVDLWCGEKADLSLRGDHWYRFAHGVAGGTPTSFSNAPNAYVAQISDDMRAGKPDAYLLHILEAYAQGCCDSVPYGAWLAHHRKDAIIMPKPLADRLGRWLKEHETLFPERPVANLAILYDHAVAWEDEELGGVQRFHPDSPPERKPRQTFEALGKLLCREHRLYRVELVSEHRPLTLDRLMPYRSLILPDCYLMPEAACQAVEAWISGGGRALVIGNAPRRLAGADVLAVFDEERILEWARIEAQPIEAQAPADIGLGLHATEDGYVLHLVNYRLHPEEKRVALIPEMRFDLEFDAELSTIAAFPDGGLAVSLEGKTLRVENAGLYSLVALRTRRD